MTDELQVSNFLDSLRLHLRPMTIGDREEIVREIGAHIRDSAEAYATPVEIVLERLGPARELAAQYRDGLLLSKAGRSLSPLLLLRASLRLATKGVFGFVVFMLRPDRICERRRVSACGFHQATRSRARRRVCRERKIDLARNIDLGAAELA